MHRNIFPPACRALAAGALALALAACVDQPGLFDPDTETPVSADAPILRLGTDTLALREGDRLSFPVNARGGKGVQAEIFLVDSARNVLWRSGTGPAVRDSASVSFTGLPADVARGRRVFLTGALVDDQGKRVYATRDTVPAASLALAALQPTIVYEGHLLTVEGRVVALAAARDLGRVYFADQVKGTIGVVDLATLALRPAFPVGAHPEALAYMRGRLGVLSDAGVEVAAFDVAAGNRLLSKTIIPPLLARMRVPTDQLDESGKPSFQNFRYQVRPYARNLALVCAGSSPDCPEVAAFGSSEMVDPGGGSQGVGLREIGFAGRTAFPFLAPPQFNPETVANDSIPAELTTLDASVPTGRDSIVYQAGSVGRCNVLNAGGTAIAGSPYPNGSVYVGLDPKVSDCKLDVPLIRLDRPDGPTAQGTQPPVVSLLAFRNLLGENRITETRALDVSEDGARVLVLDRDRIHVLDDALRLRETLAVPGVQAIAWLREEGAVSRFAVVTEDAVEIYGARDMVRQGRIVLGKLSGLAAFARVNGETVVVVVPRDAKGVLVARIPLP
ncbi:MAG TPA: hypothetical protein VF584_07385 [Longimicrobium sp.]|jgi:hypothetical protein